MNCIANFLPYQHTGYFSRLIVDYLEDAASLRPFYSHRPTLEGILSAIHDRRQYPTNRKVLVKELKNQYRGFELNEITSRNLDQLLDDNCFTVTTAHQPAIFTGPLYFIYKILHTIKLADFLAKEIPDNKFVPVFFMGSEDADLQELGQIYLDHEKITWDARQSGAVGRMKPKELDPIFSRIEGEYSVQPFGRELLDLLKRCYLESDSIQTATFKLVHSLFENYGLIILIPDNANFKKLMLPVFEDDLFNHKPSLLVGKTIHDLSAEYEIQANPRDINLFYLKGDIRERIAIEEGTYHVVGTDIHFSEEEMRKELKEYPERFSPNVILRGLFQETILPNIAFLGGGSEIGYWLEFKNMFGHYQVPYPVQIMRNSFLIIEKRWRDKLEKARIAMDDIFKSEEDLVGELVKKESRHQLNLEKEIEDANAYYENLKRISLPIDPTLTQYVDALKTKAVKPIVDLEKKLLKAEKRKFEDQRMHIHSIKSALFPMDNLQERIENFMPYYAEWGREFINMIYQHSLALEQQFVVLEEVNAS
ncbi:MAG: bacillithiol biosynthesis cysteine-adding enzyme BshC [Bacteroidetes bacterium]|nr:MAG: bacillithiol biosynthesis cysteine-adding enzyme BshC [Bacteroidota bacterium]